MPFNSIGVPFIELQSVDSSNNYALKQTHEGKSQHGMTFFAHEQLAGKGQRGKVWKSEKGANIILSVIIQPDFLSVSDQFQLSACVAVAVHDFFSQYAGNDTKIKWPNDLYWQNKKAGGILIANIIGSNAPGWKWAVVGIGININQVSFSADLKNPVSLKQITGKNFDTVKMAKELCKKLDSYYRQLMESGFENIYSYYLSHLYKKDQVVKLQKDKRVFTVTIKSVSPSGQLIVQNAIEEHPMDIRFEFGEVEWL